jgi:peptidoglycan/xylan/chitin deacetylase (PgdA/CDA1 family)
MHPKQFVREPALQLAARLGPHRWPGRSSRLWILMYHRVLPLELALAAGEEPGMYVTPETFARHLAWINEDFTVVRLADWVARVAAGMNVPSRACAITFDDGWHDNFEFALPLLQRAGTPATLFAVSHLVGTTEQFWPARIDRLLRQRIGVVTQHPACAWLRDIAVSGGIELERACTNSEIRASLFGACKTFSDERLHALLGEAEQLAELPPPTERSLVDWVELRQMIDTGLIDVGSHTRHHFRLRPDLPSHVMAAEISGSRAKLESKLGRRAKLFCYPNGDFTPEAADLVAQEYAAGVTTARGINTPSTPMNRLRRIGMHEDISSTKAHFFARLSGWV